MLSSVDVLQEMPLHAHAPKKKSRSSRVAISRTLPPPPAADNGPASVADSSLDSLNNPCGHCALAIATVAAGAGLANAVGMTSFAITAMPPLLVLGVNTLWGDIAEVFGPEA